MAVARLLHFIPNSGACRNRKSHQQLKCSITRDKLRLSIDHKSSLTSDHDSSARSLSDCIKRPICTIPYKYNALKCRCSLLPDSVTKIPASIAKIPVSVTQIPFVQRAIVAIRGPSTPLPSSPSIANLVIAVAVLIFILWGLQPLVRTGRNVFLHKDDTTWRKSNTHHLLTSYLQPFLLWVGVMFVCRALDPVVMPTKVSSLIKERVITFIRSLSTVVALAYCVSCAVKRAHKVFVETNEHPDAGSMGFQLAGKAVYTSVWIAAVSLFMELLGFSAKKWLTAGGLGTVLLTLAGREIFTNFLSSVIIQATRPFVLNEWIQTKIEGYDVSGTVEDVGWWSPTLIRGEDREAVYIPNHKFTVNIVRNLSQKTHWRIRASLAISHLDVNKINTIVADMRKVLAKNPQVEQQKLHRRVFLDTINPENQALTILISCFVETTHHEEYLCVKEAILLDLLRVITHHGARLATPIRTIQKHHSDPEMDNPFSESVFSRDHVPPNRPFFLIEPPSYKINGEGSTKARTARSGGHDSQAARQQSPSDSTEDVKIKEPPKSGIAALDQDSQASRKQSKLKETSAAQSKTGETPKSGSAAPDEDAKLKGTSTSTSTSQASDSKVTQPDVKASDTSSNSDKKSSSGDSQQQSVKTESQVSSSEDGDRKSSSQPKQAEKPSAAKTKQTVEENIVLEVALDGSKRTLPVDEYRPATSATPNENGDGAPTIKQADKDN